MLYAFGVFIIIGAIYEICYNFRASVFKKNLHALYSISQENKIIINYETLKGLPEPVASYLKKVTTENNMVISTFSLQHNGYFKTALNKKWTRIRGEEYFTVYPPGFLWQGKTEFFNAFDSYIGNKGNFSVWLFGALPFFLKKGTQINQSELTRWVCESILFPSALFPSDTIYWQAVSSREALLHYNTDKSVYYFRVFFNDHNEISHIETNRIMNKELHKWRGRFDNYQTVDGYKIPTRLEASWIINDKEYPYARFSIDKIKINPYRRESEKKISK